MDTDKLIAGIRARVAALRWSKNRLAQQAGVGESTLRNFHDPDWSPSVSTLRRLEAALRDQDEDAAA